MGNRQIPPGDNQRTSTTAGDVAYTPSQPSNWRPTVPSLVSTALDMLAALIVAMRAWLVTSTDPIYVNNDTGNDDTGTGAIGNPYGSIDYALLVRGFLPSIAASVPIILQTTGIDYTIGTGIKVTSYTLVESTGLVTVAGGARTFTDAGSSANVGIVVAIGGVAPADDALVGLRVKWVDGTLAGQYGQITKNVGATVYVTSSDPSGAFTNPTAGGGANLLIQTAPARIALDQNLSIEETFGLTFQDLDIDGGGNNIVHTATNYVKYVRCFLTNVTTLVIAAGAAVNLQTTTYNGTGDDGDSSGANGGMLLVRPSAVLHMEDGSAVIGDAAATTGRFVAMYGTLTLRGENVGRRLNGSLKGFYCEASKVLGRAGTVVAGGASNVLRFADCDGPLFQINGTAGGSSAGVGGLIDLPRLTDTGGGHATSGQYVVTATLNAIVQVNGGTATNNAGTVLPVSADNGATGTCSNADGTVIRGGLPTGGYHPAPGFPGFATPQTAVGETNVYGDFNLKNDATNDAGVDCQVETGIGTGLYTTVQSMTLSKPSVPTDPDQFAFNFYCPAARRFQFIARTGGGATAVNGHYNTVVK